MATASFGFDPNSIDNVIAANAGMQLPDVNPEAVPDGPLNLLPHAKAAVDLGFSIFPLGSKSKKPLPGSHGFQDSRGPSDPRVLEPWVLDPSLNIGIDLGASGRTVLDFDKLESIPNWVNALRTLKVGTSRGVHVHCSGSHPNAALFIDGVKVGDLQIGG